MGPEAGGFGFWRKDRKRAQKPIISVGSHNSTYFGDFRGEITLGNPPKKTMIIIFQIVLRKGIYWLPIRVFKKDGFQLFSYTQYSDCIQYLKLFVSFPQKYVVSEK